MCVGVGDNRLCMTVILLFFGVWEMTVHTLLWGKGNLMGLVFFCGVQGTGNALWNGYVCVRGGTF